MDSVLILAAGEGLRFNGKPKQLIELQYGETILKRIIRQVRARGCEPIVVTHKEEIATHVKGVEVINPAARRWTVETLLSTAPYWGERTVVLLGDVVYSMRVMNELFDCKAPIRVFGHEYEIFGIVFTRACIEAVKGALRKVVSIGHPGTLRWFYQQYCGLPLGGEEVEKRVFHRVCYIEDYTRDVDTPGDLESLRMAIRRGRLQDE